ncbi:hypothetical protein RJ640_009417 [Escallonia rubra]|uniref:Inhibitor I9 domain-containing protein n=1 Tax=Escallonia rubra TaxID=112253 RepID=A0AA88QNJ7_9ASTE|nr:hypothetical protein RJ640_009417 [Escallonia rubra]
MFCFQWVWCDECGEWPLLLEEEERGGRRRRRCCNTGVAAILPAAWGEGVLQQPLETVSPSDLCQSSWVSWNIQAAQVAGSRTLLLRPSTFVWHQESWNHRLIERDVLVRMMESPAKIGRASESLLRSYTRSFNGFAAKLTEEESKSLASG